MVKAENPRIIPPDDLEEFDPGKPPPDKETWITLTSTKYVVYSPAAREALGSPPAVVYVYSPRERILGFKAAEPDAPNSYPLYQQGNSRNSQSAAGKLYRYYGIPTPEQATRYKAELHGDTLFIDLKDENAVLVNRKPKAMHPEGGSKGEEAKAG